MKIAETLKDFSHLILIKNEKDLYQMVKGINRDLMAEEKIKHVILT